MKLAKQHSVVLGDGQGAAASGCSTSGLHCPYLTHPGGLVDKCVVKLNSFDVKLNMR